MVMTVKLESCEALGKCDCVGHVGLAPYARVTGACSGGKVSEVVQARLKSPSTKRDLGKAKSQHLNERRKH